MAIASSAAIAPLAPKEQPALDQVYVQVNSNTEQVRVLVADVRTFIGRALGRNMGDPPGSEAPVPEGAVNLITDALATQSLCLQELRDAVNMLPEIA